MSKKLNNNFKKNNPNAKKTILIFLDGFFFTARIDTYKIIAETTNAIEFIATLKVCVISIKGLKKSHGCAKTND